MRAHDQTEIASANAPAPPFLDCALYNIGRVSYTKAINLQLDLHARCVSGEISGALILLEHDPVLTMGVKTARENVLASPEALQAQGIELVQTDRGGDVTYHGPGQLVGYPILPLRKLGSDLHAYLRSLEQVIIETLAEFGLEGERNPPAGVWVGGRKICSIGIAVRKWVSYHGFALNVDPIMRHFGLINPCGLDSNRMTSMAELLGAAPDMAQVREICASKFVQLFRLNLCNTETGCFGISDMRCCEGADSPNPETPLQVPAC